MIDCPLQLVDGKWTCPQCGWAYKLTSDDPPKRNCPKAPRGVDAVLQLVGNRLGQTTACDNGEWDEIERRGRVCVICPRRRFRGYTGTDRGSRCRHWERWIERLVYGRCGCWESAAEDTAENEQGQRDADHHADDGTADT